MLLWSLGTLFLLPMLGGVVGLFMECRSRYDARQRLAAAGVFLGAVAAAGLWLGAVGYCGYRAFHAIP